MRISRTPYYIVLSAIAALMSSCAQQTLETGKMTIPTSSRDAAGELTVRDLQTRLHTTGLACVNRMPAFHCTGVIMRGAEGTNGEEIWEPDQNDTKQGKLSMSFYREDTAFDPNWSGYTSGMLFYLNVAPTSSGAPSEAKLKLDVMCAFPTNGASTGRPENGCGGASDRSERCEKQGIRTAEQWIAHFEETHVPCSLNVGNRTVGADEAFRVFLEVAEHYRRKDLNEFVVRVWAPCQADRLPIQAFYYIVGAGDDADALRRARENQVLFFAATQGRIVVPVIRFKMLNAPGDTFTYRAEDQATESALQEGYHQRKASGVTCTGARKSGSKGQGS